MSTIRDRRKQNMVNGNVTHYKSVGKRTRLLAVLLIISLVFTGLSGIGNYQVYADEEDTGSGNINQEDITDYVDDYGITHLKDGSISMPSGTVTASNGMIIVPSGYVLSSGEDGFVEEGILTDGKLVLSDGSTICSDGSIELPDNSGDVNEEENVPEEDTTPAESDNEAIISAIKTKIAFITSSEYFLINVMGIEDIDNSTVSEEECIPALVSIVAEYANYDDHDKDYSSLLEYINDSNALSDEWLNERDLDYLDLLNDILNDIYSSILVPVMLLGEDLPCSNGTHTSGGNDYKGSHTNCVFKSGCKIVDGLYTDCTFNGCSLQIPKDNEVVLDNCIIDSSNGSVFSIDGNCILKNNTVFQNSETYFYITATGKISATDTSFKDNTGNYVITIANHTYNDEACCTLNNCSFINNRLAIDGAYKSKIIINNCTFKGNTGYYSGTHGSDLLVYDNDCIVEINGFTGEGTGEKNVNDAGSMYIDCGTVSINNATFNNYHSKENGGAIYFASGSHGANPGETSNLTINNTSFTNCSSNLGGAIYSDKKLLNLDSVSFSNCSATDKGGAIYYGYNGVSDTVALNLNNCNFTENSAGTSGGAIDISSNKPNTEVSLNNTSIINNITNNQTESGYFGAGIYIRNPLKISLSGNTVVKNNITNGSKKDDICFVNILGNITDAESFSGKVFDYLKLNNFKGEAYLQRSESYTGTTNDLSDYFGDIKLTAGDSSTGILGIDDNDGVIAKFGTGPFRFRKLGNYYTLPEFKLITRIDLGLNTKEIVRFDKFNLINDEAGTNPPQVIPVSVTCRNANGTETKIDCDSTGPISVNTVWTREPSDEVLDGNSASKPDDTGYVANVKLNVTDSAIDDGYIISKNDPEVLVYWNFVKKVGDKWVSDGSNIKDTNHKTIQEHSVDGPKYAYSVKHLKATKNGFNVTSVVEPKKITSDLKLYDDIDISFEVDTDASSIKDLPNSLTAFLYKKNSSGGYDLYKHFEITRSSPGTKLYKGSISDVLFDDFNGDVVIAVKCGVYSGSTFVEGKYVNDATQFNDIYGVAIEKNIDIDVVKQETPVILVKTAIADGAKGKLTCDLNSHHSFNSNGIFEISYKATDSATNTFISSFKPDYSSMTYEYEDNKIGFYSIRYPELYYDTRHKNIVCKLSNGEFVTSTGGNISIIPMDLIKLAEASEWSTTALLDDNPVIANVAYEFTHSGKSNCGIDESVEISDSSEFSLLDTVTAKVSLGPGLSWGDLSKSKVGSQLNVEWYTIKDDEEYILKTDTVSFTKNKVSYTIPATQKAFVNGESRSIDLTTVKAFYFRVVPRTNSSGDTYQTKYDQKFANRRLHQDTRNKPDLIGINTTNETSLDGKVIGKDLSKLYFRTSPTEPWQYVKDDPRFVNDELTNLDKGTYYFKYAASDGYMDADQINFATVVIDVGKAAIGGLVVTSEHVKSGVCTVEKSPNGDLMVGDKLTAVFALAKGLDWGLLADNGKEIIGSSLTLQYVKYVPELDVNGNIKKDADGNDIYKEVILDTARLTEKKTTAEYYMTADDVGYRIEVRVLPDARDLYHSNAVVMTKQTVGKHTASTKAPVFKPTAETGPGKNDGTITSKEMIDLDYKYGEDGKWIKVSTDKEHFKLTVLEKLKPGKYYFRRSESATNLAGTKIYEVIVEAKAEPSPGVTPMPGSDATGDKIAPDKKSSSSGVRPKVTSENLPEAKITPVIFATPEVVEEEEQIPTKINIEPIDVPNGDDIYLEAKINSSEADLYDALLNEDEKNSERDVKVHLTCTDSDLMLTDEQTDQVRNVAKGYTLGAVLDVGIFKQYDNGSIYQVSQTSDPIEITAHVPTSIQNWDQNIVRDYIVVRFHDNEAPVVLPCTYNKLDRTVTFNTDKFSVYVLMYQDNTKALAIGNKVWDLLSTKYILLFFLLLSTFLVALIVWDVKKGNNVYSINL